MRQHPVTHAFTRLHATLPAWKMYLRTMVDAFQTQGDPLPTVTALLSTVWEPNKGVSTTIETTVPTLQGASAHQRLIAARAQGELETWAATTAAHMETLMLAVVANDPRKPFLRMDFLAEGNLLSNPLHLRLLEGQPLPVGPPDFFYELTKQHTPRILRGLRLAAMAKGVGTGPRWSLWVDGKRTQFHVQAPTERVALAWMVGTQTPQLLDWVRNGRFVELSVENRPATALLQRWSKIRPNLAPTPTLESHLGF